MDCVELMAMYVKENKFRPLAEIVSLIQINKRIDHQLNVDVMK